MTQKDISKEKQAIEIGDNDQDGFGKGVASFKKNSKVIIFCLQLLYCNFFIFSRVREPQRSTGCVVK